MSDCERHNIDRPPAQPAHPRTDAEVELTDRTPKEATRGRHRHQTHGELRTSSRPTNSPSGSRPQEALSTRAVTRPERNS